MNRAPQFMPGRSAIDGPPKMPPLQTRVEKISSRGDFSPRQRENLLASRKKWLVFLGRIPTIALLQVRLLVSLPKCPRFSWASKTSRDEEKNLAGIFWGELTIVLLPGALVRLSKIDLNLFLAISCSIGLRSHIPRLLPTRTPSSIVNVHNGIHSLTPSADRGAKSTHVP